MLRGRTNTVTEVVIDLFGVLGYCMPDAASCRISGNGE